MKKALTILFISFYSYSLLAQPFMFSWTSKHKGYNYISSAKDQEELGPCNIFASVAAVEAMAQIYFNKNWASLDLSESNIYNNTCGLGCGTTVPYALGFVRDSGIVNEVCFQYPIPENLETYCYPDCNYKCASPTQRVYIPHFSQITIANNDNDALKQAIMDYGPIIVSLPDADPSTGKRASCVMHPEDNDCNISHTVLLLGWQSSPLQWHIKDSWPGDSIIGYFNLNVFSYNPTFYRVHPYDIHDDLNNTAKFV